MPDQTRYDTDPEALAWARSKVGRVIAKYRGFERHCKERGDLGRAAMWRKFANLLEMELIGGKGCVVTPFDERKPEMARLMEAQVTAPEPER